MMWVFLVSLNWNLYNALYFVNEIQNDRIVLVMLWFIVITQPNLWCLNQQPYLFVQSHHFNINFMFLIIAKKNYSIQRLQKLILSKNLFDKQRYSFQVNIVGIRVIEKKKQKLEGVLSLHKGLLQSFFYDNWVDKLFFWLFCYVMLLVL